MAMVVEWARKILLAWIVALGAFAVLLGTVVMARLAWMMLTGDFGAPLTIRMG